jgi:hypothetical protein
MQPQTIGLEWVSSFKAFWLILWLLMGRREKGTGCNVNNNSKCNRPSAKGSCWSDFQSMLATRLTGQDRAPTTKMNGNVIFNFSVRIVFSSRYII